MLVYFGVVFVIFIFFAIINTKVKYKTKFWQRFLVIIFVYFFAFVIISIFPRLLIFDEKFPSHLDWEYTETIKEEDALIYIFAYQSKVDNETTNYIPMVFQKIGFLVMPWPGYDYSFENYQIYKYSGEDNIYQDNKAHSIAYKVGNEKYLICLKVYGGQEMDISSINYNNQDVDFQVSEVDSNMIFFFSDVPKAELVINNLSYEPWV